MASALRSISPPSSDRFPVPRHGICVATGLDRHVPAPARHSCMCRSRRAGVVPSVGHIFGAFLSLANLAALMTSRRGDASHWLTYQCSGSPLAPSTVVRHEAKFRAWG